MIVSCHRNQTTALAPVSHVGRSMCGSRKYPCPPAPVEGHWKFLGGRGLFKAKLLEEKYEAKLEFHGG